MEVEYNFCPGCAHPLEDRPAFGRVRRCCPRCDFVHFRDPKMAVGVLIEDPLGRALLVKRAVRPRIGFWALPGGFMDHDEVPREAARREVQEETGLLVQVQGVLDIAPLGREDHRRGVIIFFSGTPCGGSLCPGDDASEARWFAADDLPFAELAFTGTGRVLDAWRLSRGPKG